MEEVKRRAVAELQRAVTAAEVKATVAVTAERARLEKVVNEVRAQARHEAFALLNSQEDSTEVDNRAVSLVPICTRPHTLPGVAVWRSGNFVDHINEVALRRARLVLRWMAVFGWHTTLYLYQATQANSASCPRRDEK